jgi:hypothetical protein
LAHERAGILKSPVIVDRESLVVLDGMHRVEALRNLGCRFMCVCLVDYMSPGIRVDRWFRVVSSPISIEEFSSRFGDLRAITKAVGSLSQAASFLLMLEEGSYELATHGEGVVSVFEVVTSIEAWILKNGHTIGYEMERDEAKMLEHRSLRRVPPGYRWGSRLYEEAVYLFE